MKFHCGRLPFRLFIPNRFALCGIVLAFAGVLPAQGQQRLLVFSKTTDFRHAVIPNAIAAIQTMGPTSGFIVDTTQDSRLFTRQNLSRYQAVFFNHVTGNVFDTAQQAAFKAFIQAGGGFAAIHASSWTELQWPWFTSLVGANFVSHSAVVPGTLTVVDRTHLSTSALPATWIRTDEWYNFTINPRPNVTVLITIDENTYTGGTMGADHPIAWYHAYDGGRAWYSALGHPPESYTNPNFLAHLRGGILYALGPSTSIRLVKNQLQPEKNGDRFGFPFFRREKEGKDRAYSLTGVLLPEVFPQPK